MRSSKKGAQGDIHRQFANTRISMGEVFKLIQRGYRVFVTHGNGTRVVDLMLIDGQGSGDLA